jgi:beta-lactamase superfamily II metal-dependent hydrolase
MGYVTEVTNGKKRIFGFATYPDVVMYDSHENGKAVTHLIFGDYINLLPDRNQQDVRTAGDWIYARCRKKNGWIKLNQVQKDRILEVNFVDIGQGDGCHIVTPHDRHIILDAGQEDNMYRFLSWRFNLRRKRNRVKQLTAVITHPDQDHYKGFQKLFEHPQLNFSNIYHNGIVERAADPVSSLGGFTKIRNRKYLSDIVEDDASMKALVGDATKRGRKNYPKTLYQAMTNPSNTNIRFQMLHRDQGYMPGYEADKPMSLEILGPVVERDASGRLALKYFSNSGKTKNGHSISLMLRIGKIKILLAGDLNIEAENYLLNHYTGKDPQKLVKQIHKETDPTKIAKLRLKMSELIEKGRDVYRADIAKSCHHGSHHFTTEFLKSINALATIISSGDNESHGHPRPDALGAFGKYGRGERPLIFSTELARSHKEIIKKPFQFKRSIKYYSKAIDKEPDPDKKKKLENKLNRLLDQIERTVAVYGMINVRTDGEHAIICQKLEKPRSPAQKWDIHELIYNAETHGFQYRIKLKH